MTEQLYRWVKASERMPEGRVIARWNHGGDPEAERIDILDKQQMEMFDNVSEAPTLEWLEPYTPSLNAGSLEEAAKEHANYEVGECDIDEDVHDPDFVAEYKKAWNKITAAFLAGAAYVKGGEENHVLGLLISGGFIDPSKVEEAREIAKGFSPDLSIVEKLRLANPCDNDDFLPSEPNPYLAWNDCCDKLKELLNQSK